MRPYVTHLLSFVSYIIDVGRPHLFMWQLIKWRQLGPTDLTRSTFHKFRWVLLLALEYSWFLKVRENLRYPPFHHLESKVITPYVKRTLSTGKMCEPKCGGLFSYLVDWPLRFLSFKTGPYFEMCTPTQSTWWCPMILCVWVTFLTAGHLGMNSSHSTNFSFISKLVVVKKMLICFLIVETSLKTVKYLIWYWDDVMWQAHLNVLNNTRKVNNEVVCHLLNYFIVIKKRTRSRYAANYFRIQLGLLSLLINHFCFGVKNRGEEKWAYNAFSFMVTRSLIGV